MSEVCSPSVFSSSTAGSSPSCIGVILSSFGGGGNFLLNVGPTAEGLIPGPSIDRLKAIGTWMDKNSESIYSTKASPFKTLDWGRCTQKDIDGGTRLYLHVFDWPQDGRLVVPGIYNQIIQASLLADPKSEDLKTERNEDAIIIDVPQTAPDQINSVIVLDIEGEPDVNDPPEIVADFDIFIDEIIVEIKTDRENIEMHYTTDGSVPSIESAKVVDEIRLDKTTTISARCFRDGKPVSGVKQKTIQKVKPQSAETAENLIQGLQYAYYEGEWDSLPDFNKLKSVKRGLLKKIDFSPRNQVEYFGFVYSGYIKIPQSGVYAFYTDSDDGSRLSIGKKVVVDNDGLHGLREHSGVIPLEKGYHPLRIEFFEKTGGEELMVSIMGPNLKKQPIPIHMLFSIK